MNKALFTEILSLTTVCGPFIPVNHPVLLSEKSFSADLKIADFGFARETAEHMQSQLGSPLYMAPEILQGRVYSSKSDLWSVGWFDKL